MEETIRIMVTCEQNSVLPKYAFKNDACVDLFYNGPSFVLGSMETQKCGTGIRMQIPVGYLGMVCSRSGLAKKGVIVSNAPGIIDSGYRGEVCVLLTNTSKDESEINTGDRIAQLVVLPYPEIVFEQTQSLEDTDRGTGGFGSSGK